MQLVTSMFSAVRQTELNLSSSCIVSYVSHCFLWLVKRYVYLKWKFSWAFKNHHLVVYWKVFIEMYKKPSLKYISYSSCNSYTDNPHQQERWKCFLKQSCCLCNRSDLCKMVHNSKEYLKSKPIDPLKGLVLLHKSGLKTTISYPIIVIPRIH